MVTEADGKRYLRDIRLMYIWLMFVVVPYAGLFSKIQSAKTPPFAVSTQILSWTEGTLAVLSMFAIGAIMVVTHFNLMNATRKGKPADATVPTAFVVRGAVFQIPGLFALVLGLMGAGWTIFFLFSAASVLTVAVNFPTKQRWLRMISTVNGGAN